MKFPYAPQPMHIPDGFLSSLVSILNLLRELPMTMLVASHDLAMVRELFPRMVIMDEGCIVADGMTKALMEDTQLLEAHGLERL